MDKWFWMVLVFLMSAVAEATPIECVGSMKAELIEVEGSQIDLNAVRPDQVVIWQDHRSIVVRAGHKIVVIHQDGSMQDSSGMLPTPGLALVFHIEDQSKIAALEEALSTDLSPEPLNCIGQLCRVFQTAGLPFQNLGPKPALPNLWVSALNGNLQQHAPWSEAEVLAVRAEGGQITAQALISQAIMRASELNSYDPSQAKMLSSDAGSTSMTKLWIGLGAVGTALGLVAVYFIVF